MSDAISAAAELRSLEEKRRAIGLTPEEEARRTALASSAAPPPPPARGFDVGAAAARVREEGGGSRRAHEATAFWDLGTAAAAEPSPEPSAPAPIAAGPVEAAAVEAAPVEADPVEPAPLDADLLEADAIDVDVVDVETVEVETVEPEVGASKPRMVEDTAAEPASPAPAPVEPIDSETIEPETILELEPEPVEPEPAELSTGGAAQAEPVLPHPPVPEVGADPTLGSPVDLTELLAGAPAEPPPPEPLSEPLSEPPRIPPAPPAGAVVARLTPVPYVPAVADPTPATAPPPPAPSPGVVGGAQRVVLHTAGGLVKRGVVTDFDPQAGELWFAAQEGGPATPVAAEAVHAIFFMLSPAQPPPAPLGRKVQVTFRDGRQVAGTTEDYHPDRAGFFVIPLDGRTRTARIWVYRSAARRVVVE